MMQERREAKREKLLQYAERVWNLCEGDAEQRIDAAIEKTRAFFESLGVSFSGIGGGFLSLVLMMVFHCGSHFLVIKLAL